MRSDRRRDDAGMVTAELAACLPVLVVVLAVAISAVAVVAARVRCADAAREAARAAARGDPVTAQRVAAAAGPGTRLTVQTGSTTVVVIARVTIHPLGGWLPAVTVTERAVSAREPTTAAGAPP